MKNFKNVMLLALVSSLLSLGSIRSSADGLPVPWPFPWAKDCPIEWSAMGGRYLLSDAKNLQYIDLKFTAMTKEGFKLVHVARYNQNAELLYEGFTYVSENQRTLRLSLMPSDRTAEALSAVIKLHYQSNDLRCAANYLVPILTLEPMDSNNSQVTRYKLVRVGTSR